MLISPVKLERCIHFVRTFIYYQRSNEANLLSIILYSKTCLKRPLSKRPQIVFKINYRLMNVKSIAKYFKWSILQFFRLSLTYLFVIKIFNFSNFEWPFYTGCTRIIFLYISPNICFVCPNLSPLLSPYNICFRREIRNYFLQTHVFLKACKHPYFT